MLTKGTWVKIALIVALCLFLCAGAVSCSYGCTPFVRGCSAIPSNFGSVAAAYANQGSGSCPADQVHDIDLGWLEGSVSIEVVDDPALDEIQLEESSRVGEVADEWKTSWEVIDGVLRIAYCRALNGIVGCSPSAGPYKSLTIRIPASACEHLGIVSIDAFSGEYRLDGLACDKLQLDLASGKATGTGEFDAMVIDMASGKIDLSARVAGELDADVASGDLAIAFQEAMPRHAKLDMASGSTVFAVPEDAGLTARIDKMSGNFHSDFPGTMDSDGVYVKGDGACAMDISMASGNVTLKGNDA